MLDAMEIALGVVEDRSQKEVERMDGETRVRESCIPPVVILTRELIPTSMASSSSTTRSTH
jgi:hypothetical protein